jgi:hypothetical protein
VEVAGEVAFEQACRVAFALVVGDASRDVVLGCGVVLAAVQRDRVQRAVELAVAAAAEPVPLSLPAWGGDGCDAGEARKAGFWAQPAVVWPGDDQLGGDGWSDAGLVEQGGRERANVAGQFPFELVGFDGCW